ncbi:hypothetical protein CLPU_9c00650 [Gottschalkia purinilytica]|uniref:DUF2935 domain-containing protein n=1 Tax=Gottschalkia purinilytica TaxID=1503 RepID=A0A0L0W9E9_GOTPU|nr:DUF2935 domain-containing protein [Gottschalkia purinilytica]KNF08169.1 hypothetical protein CLPU_9c00650 [Gottschalkia purinilytica]
MVSFVDESFEINNFWLRIMRDHAIFINSGLPCKRKDFIGKSIFFRKAYEVLLDKVNKLDSPTTEDMQEINEQAIRLTKKYIVYKTQLLNYNLSCESPLTNLYSLFLEHLRREAYKFIKTLELLQSGKKQILGLKAINEEVFWIRIMADHSKFIVHLLDPSERLLEKQVRKFSKLFDDLRFQSIDLKGMISPSYDIIPVIDRFTDEVIESTEKLKDFKETATELIGECKIVSNIPELLADHVTREAEFFLKELKEIREAIK